MNEEKRGGVLSEQILTPQEYCWKYYDVKLEFSGKQGELRKWLDENGHTDIWDYPLSEIEEIVENELLVVLVDIAPDTTHEYRWFEVKQPNFVETFGELIDHNFTAEEFTGHLGVLLDEDASEEDKQPALSFLEDVYALAAQFIS